MGGGEKRETEANAADLAWLEGRWLSESAEGVFRRDLEFRPSRNDCGYGEIIPR
ncbi:MAG: hypothetical protein UZ18_ATM001000465 [Armatimonadetes bacterium OLB18]|nr:MAG: hypothetical protein UZ18_ATM001000465 [Armatimonadetes bacterium OLB18]